MKHPYPKNIFPRDDGMPSVFYVETVLACNLRCPECVIGTDNVERKKRTMKLSEFLEISKKIEKYAKLVYLHKWGEPTMNKDIYDMVAITSEYAHSHIMTNGLLLNKEKIKTLMLNGLGTLIFSIDGFSQGVYEKYRVGGQLSIALENLLHARDVNEELGNITDVIAQFIVFKHNEHELEDFIKFCNKSNIRYFVRTAYIRYGSVDVPVEDKYKRTIFTAKKLHINAISQCPHAHNTMTITADGTLLLCSQDYNANYGLGNLLNRESDIKNLWLASKYLSLRESIKNKNPPYICKADCMIYPSNLIY